MAGHGISPHSPQDLKVTIVFYLKLCVQITAKLMILVMLGHVRMLTHLTKMVNIVNNTSDQTRAC